MGIMKRETKVGFVGLLVLVVFTVLFFKIDTLGWFSDREISKEDKKSFHVSSEETASTKSERSVGELENLTKLQRIAHEELNEEWNLLSERDSEVGKLRAITRDFQHHGYRRMPNSLLFKASRFIKRSEENRELLEDYRIYSLAEAFSAMKEDDYWKPYLDEYQSEMSRKLDEVLETEDVDYSAYPWARHTWFVKKDELNLIKNGGQPESWENFESSIPPDVREFMDESLSHALAYEAAKFSLKKKKTPRIIELEDRFYQISAELRPYIHR